MAKRNVVRELIAKLSLDSTDALKKAEEFDKAVKTVKTNLNLLHKASKGCLSSFSENIKKSKGDMALFAKSVKEAKDNFKDFKVKGAVSFRGGGSGSGGYHSTRNPVDGLLAGLNLRKVDLSYIDKAMNKGDLSRKQALNQINQLEKSMEKLAVRSEHVKLDDKGFKAVDKEVAHILSEIDRLRAKASSIPVSKPGGRWQGTEGMIAGMLGAMNSGSPGGFIGTILGGLIGRGSPIAGMLVGAIVTPLVDGIVNGITNGVRMAVNAIRGIMDTGISEESIINKYKAVFGGDIKGAAAEYAYMNKIVRELGIDYESTATSYASFIASTKNSGVSIKQSREMFTEMAEVFTSLHMNSQQVQYSMLALEQMYNKGKVSSEELRRQLAEQIPGAFELFAKALGKTPAQLSDALKNGEIITKEALPKAIALLNKTYTGSLESAKKATQADLNRIGYYWRVFKREIWMGGLKSGLGEIFKTVSNFLSGDRVDKFGKKLGTAFKNIAHSKTFKDLLEKAYNFANKLVDTLSDPKFISNMGSIIESIASITGSLMELATAGLRPVAQILEHIVALVKILNGGLLNAAAGDFAREQAGFARNFAARSLMQSGHIAKSYVNSKGQEVTLISKDTYNINANEHEKVSSIIKDLRHGRFSGYSKVINNTNTSRALPWIEMNP